MDANEEDEARTLEQIKNQSRSWGPRAKPIRQVVKSLLVKRGINDEQSALEIESAWHRVATAAVVAETQVGKFYRGSLTIWAANSIVLSEVSLLRVQLLKGLQAELPHLKLKGLRLQLSSDGLRKRP